MGKNLSLSKKRVTPGDRQRCTEVYSKGKAVNSILKRVAFIQGYNRNKKLEALYSKTAWAVGFQKSSMYVYEYFKQAATDTRLLDELELDEETRRVLLETLKSRFNQHRVKIRAYIEVTCFTHDGID